jgi:hypothetical protein
MEDLVMKKSKALVCTACAAVLLAGTANFQSASAAGATVTLGDLTGEGKPTVGSVVRIAKYLIGKEKFGNYARSAADVDRSGEVNIKDLLLEVLYVGGKLDKFPRPEPKMIDNPKVIDEFIPFVLDEREHDYSKVYVRIKHQYSVMNQVWTADDFGVDNIAYIEDVTYNDWTEERKKEHLENGVFRQWLCIILTEPGKEKALQMIDDIETQGILEISKVDIPNLRVELDEPPPLPPPNLP